MPQFIDIHTHNPRPDVLSPTMVGAHPWDAERGVALPELSAADIIGETGLDFVCDVSREAQEQLFRQHLEAAERLNKPVVLHVVRSFERVMSILNGYTLAGVIFHGFIGSPHQAQRCIERGYYLSFGARSIRSPRTREMIATLPHHWLFIETDDALSPSIEELYVAIAELRKEDVEELKKQLLENYNRLIIKR